MRKSATAVCAALLLLGGQVMGVGVANGQETPLCGPPGEEVPATIVGAGVIFGTSGDDVSWAAPATTWINAGKGNDIVCGEGGNDVIDGGQGSDVLIGDELDSAPFAPSNGANNDTLRGGQGDDTLAGLGGNDTARRRSRRRPAHRVGWRGHHRRRSRRRHRVRRAAERRDRRWPGQRHPVRQLRQRRDQRRPRRRLHRRRQPVPAAARWPALPARRQQRRVQRRPRRQRRSELRNRHIRNETTGGGGQVPAWPPPGGYRSPWSSVSRHRNGLRLRGPCGSARRLTLPWARPASGRARDNRAAGRTPAPGR